PPAKRPRSRPRRPAASSGSTRTHPAKGYISPSTRLPTARGAPPLAPGHHQESASPLSGEGMTFSRCSYGDIFMLQRQERAGGAAAGDRGDRTLGFFSL